MKNFEERIVRLKDVASSRLEYPHLPYFEEKRLKSILKPLPKKEAIELGYESSGIANFACIITETNQLELLSGDTEWEKYDYYVSKESIGDIIGFNSKWHAYAISDSDILNKDIIFFYVD